MAGVPVHSFGSHLNPNDPHHAAMIERTAFEADPIALLRASYLKIKTKDGEIVPFKLNSSQSRIVDAIQGQRRLGIPVRIVILKSRQTGISTLCEAIMYAFCSQRGVTQGLVLADDEEGASDIFKMNETFYDCMKQDNPHLTPQKSRSDERRMEFYSTRSGIRIDTANNKRAGRKYTYRVVHGTEVAFYKSFLQLLKGLLPSVPDRPETVIIFESTANGLGDFHKFWFEKKKLFEQGRTEWIPIFIPWTEHEEYTRAFTDPKNRQAFIESMTQDEASIMKLRNLTHEQLNWRRHTIEDVYNGDKDGFEVEYPLTDREAFKSTSRQIFSDRITLPQNDNLAQPAYRGELEMVNRKPVFIPDKQGFLKIYKQPFPEWQYIIGSDSCESALSHDEACAQVIARNTWEQVAHLHGHIAPDDLAKKLTVLGAYYNFALLCPERNGPGAVTTSKLAELYYPRICQTERHAVTDGGKWIETEEFGFHTNVKTKPQIIEKLSASLRDLLLVIHDKQTLDQLQTFVIKNQNKDGYIESGAEEGFYDDCVMALAIAVWYAHQTPIRQAQREIARPSVGFRGRTGYG